MTKLLHSPERIEGINYFDYSPIAIEIENGTISKIKRLVKLPDNVKPFIIAPGLIDIQINGYLSVPPSSLNSALIDSLAVYNYNVNARTRGHRFKLYPHHVKYDLRRYFFTNRAFNIWNSLPESVVDACTVNAFKNRLDDFWSDLDARYNWHLDITGTGDSSV